MNELLKTETENIINSNQNYFSYIDDDNHLITHLCETLSSFSVLDKENSFEINNNLYDIFTYLFYNNKDVLEEKLECKDNNSEIIKDTLTTICFLLNNGITNIIYTDIIKICNTITHKLYKLDYEEFLTRYIETEFYQRESWTKDYNSTLLGDYKLIFRIYEKDKKFYIKIENSLTTNVYTVKDKFDDYDEAVDWMGHIKDNLIDVNNEDLIDLIQ